LKSGRLNRAFVKGIDSLTDFNAYLAMQLVADITKEPDVEEVLRRIEPVGEQKESVTKTLTSILGISTERSHVQKTVIPFFKWLGSDSLASGVREKGRNKVIVAAAGTYKLLELLVDFMPYASTEDLNTIAWLVHALLDLDRPTWRLNDQIQRMATHLESHPLHKVISRLLAPDTRRDQDHQPQSVLTDDGTLGSTL